MSQNVAEFVWKRLNEWGLSRVYGYPGDGVGGLDVALEKAKDFMDYVQVRHEEMAAFMASAHAKFTGQAGALLRDIRSWRDPSADRALRCESRPYAGGRDRRSAGAFGAWRELSAGGRPPEPVRRRNRVCGNRGRARAGAHLHRSRGADRAGQAGGYLRDYSERSAGTRIRGPANGPWRDAYRRGISRRRDAAGHRGSQEGSRNSQQGQESRDPGRRGRAACDRRGDRGRQPTQRRRRQGAARQGGGARRSAVRHRLARPARHQAELGSDEAVRHIPDGGVSLSLQRVPAQTRQRARRPDRHRRRQSSRCAIRWNTA